MWINDIKVVPGSENSLEGIQDKLNLGHLPYYTFKLENKYNYYINFMGKIYVMNFDLPIMKVMDMAYWVRDNIHINGFQLWTCNKKLEADNFVEASRTIFIFFPLPGGMMDDEEELKKQGEVFITAEKVEKPKIVEEMEIRNGLFIWHDKDGRFLTRVEFFKKNQLLFEGDEQKVASHNKLLGRFFNEQIMTIKRELKMAKKPIKEQESDFNIRMKYLKNLSKECDYDLKLVAQILKDRGSPAMLDSEIRSLRSCMAKRKKPIEHKYQEPKPEKNLFNKDGIQNNDEIDKKKAEEIKTKNKERAHKKDLETENVEGMTASEAINVIQEKPHTDIQVNKVFVEDDEGLGSGLTVDEKCATVGGYCSEDSIEVEGNKGGNESDEEIKKEEEPLGTLGIIHRFKKNQHYVYEYIINTDYMGSFKKVCSKIATAITTGLGAFHLYTQFKQVYYFYGMDLKKIFAALVLMKLLEFAAKTLNIYPKYRHEVEITDIVVCNQNNMSEKREYDNNFKTTKLETKVLFEETSSFGFNMGCLGLNKMLPIKWSTTKHTASGELVANVLCPININSTISPQSVMERISKSTNIGSFIDYNRADIFSENIVNGSERLALAVIFDHRCSTLSTNIFDEVFQPRGDQAVLLPVFTKRKLQLPPGNLVWTRKKKKTTMDIFYTVSALMKLKLKNSRFPITRHLLRPKTWQIMILSSGLLWLIRKYTLTSLLAYLGLTLVTLGLWLME